MCKPVKCQQNKTEYKIHQRSPFPRKLILEIFKWPKLVVDTKIQRLFDSVKKSQAYPHVQSQEFLVYNL